MTQSSDQGARLSFGYHEIEDRLVMIVADRGGEAKSLLLTRRLTGRIVNALAHVLEKSSPEARNAHSGLRDDIVLLEHHDALHSQKAGASGSASDKGQSKSKPSIGSGPAQLVHRGRITTRPDGFTFTLMGAKQTLAAMKLSRKDLHRVLETIRRFADQADWDIKIDANWLDPDPSEIVVN